MRHNIWCELSSGPCVDERQAGRRASSKPGSGETINRLAETLSARRLVLSEAVRKAPSTVIVCDQYRVCTAFKLQCGSERARKKRDAFTVEGRWELLGCQETSGTREEDRRERRRDAGEDGAERDKDGADALDLI